MLLKHLMLLNVLSPVDCDIVVSQYGEMLDVELKSLKVKFLDFDAAEHRLDHFWF